MKIVYAPGQTCNKFWIYSNYLTQCIENNERMIVLVPDVTLKDYPNLLSSEIIKYSLYFKNIEKLIGLKRYLNILNFIFSKKYTVNIFRYTFSFIIKHDFINGTLVEKNEIKVDYSKRGFLKNAPKRTLKTKLLVKLNKVPVIYSNYIDMKRLKMLNGE